MKTISKLKGFLRLYRPDVPVIVFLGTFAGRIMTTGFEMKIIAQALFLALFPYNFVYTLNSITDRLEDSVNKPWRPLTDGTLEKKDAVLWLIFITIVSSAGIPVLFKGVEVFLAYLVVFLGISYSVPPMVLKNRVIIAPVITGWGVVHPLYITGGLELFWITSSLLAHAVGTTILKDLSDIEGDRLAGRSVITDRFSLKTVIIFSVLLSVSSFSAFLFSKHPEIAFIPGAGGAALLYNYKKRNENFSKTIYKKMIWTTACSSLIVVIYILFR